MSKKRIAIIFLFFATSIPTSVLAASNYHLVGWFNTFLPGGGQLLLGNYLRAGGEFALETSTFGLGFTMSRLSPMTIDGVPEEMPQYVRKKKISAQINLTKPIYADILQEFGLKAHMVDVFDAYRIAARANGENMARLEKRSIGDLFLQPFRPENLFNPWVYVPLLVVLTTTGIDYSNIFNSGTLPRVERITPFSNFLYSFNYEVWQPFGSGVPEEVFYRGFLQNEFYSLVPSPFFSAAMSTLAFSFSHGPDGRVGAAISGAYLGFLAEKYPGNLAPGITVHFWSVVLLGIETALLNHEAQRTSPPASLYVQVSY